MWRRQSGEDRYRLHRRMPGHSTPAGEEPATTSGLRCAPYAFVRLTLPSAPLAPLCPASAAEHQTNAHQPVNTPAAFTPAAARPTIFAPPTLDR